LQPTLSDALRGLLHDVGKIIQRAARSEEQMRIIVSNAERAIERMCSSDSECQSIVEDAKSVLSELARELLEVYRRSGASTPRHEDLSEAVLNVVLSRLGIGFGGKHIISEAIKRADSVAASERGLGPLYSSLSAREREDLFNEYRKKTFASEVNVVPMATPLWVLLLTSYVKQVGVGKKFSADLRRDVEGSWLGDAIRDLRRCSDAKQCRDVLNSIAERVRKALINSRERLWFPTRPLSWFDAVNGNPVVLYSFYEAMNRSAYPVIAVELLRDLAIALAVYSRLVELYGAYGFEETLSDILRRCALFVPAAVFGAIVPDTSLYSHSRVTAAIAIALRRSGDSYGVLKIDLGGIQRFVSRVASYKLASKAMRGRSALINLLQRATLNYAARLFETCELCSVTRESGVLTLIVPDSDAERRVSKLEEVVARASLLEFHADLSFAVAYEGGVKATNLFFGGDFAHVLDRLDRKLAVAKARRHRRIAAEALQARCVESRVRMDALSKEMVCLDESSPASSIERALGLEVTSSVLESRDLAVMAPEAFSEGDYVSAITHRALALGSAMRNAVLVIEIYTYSYGEDGLPEPYEKGVYEILDSYRAVAGFDQKLLLHRDRVNGLDVALVPIPTLGALYAVYSDHRSPALFKDREALEQVLENALEVALGHVKEVLRRVRDSLAKEGAELWVRIEILNVPELVPALMIRKHRMVRAVAEEARSILKRISLGFRFANTYMPSEKIGPDLWGPKTIEKSCRVMAIAKIDGDKVGSIVSLLAVSPSKLATLSDLVYYAFSCLAMASIYREAASGRDREVYVQYCGGDDAAYLGPILDVLWFTRALHDIAESALRPMKLSAGIWISDVRVPIAEIYKLVINTLERAKESGGNALALPRNISPAFTVDSKVLDALPMDYVSELENVVGKYRVLKNFGSLMYNLTRFSHYFADTLLREKPPIRLSLDLAKLCVSYAYLWARRESELNELISRAGLRSVPRMPGTSCLDVAKRMAVLRPALALAHLYALDRALVGS